MYLKGKEKLENIHSKAKTKDFQQQLQPYKENHLAGDHIYIKKIAIHLK